MAITALDGRTVPKYINPLPILLDPSVTLDLRSGGNQTLYINQANAYDFGLNLAGVGLAKVWGYGTSTTGSGYLGPTIVAQQDKPLHVEWINNLVDANGPLPQTIRKQVLSGITTTPSASPA
jgi:hypothetical protein